MNPYFNSHAAIWIFTPGSNELPNNKKKDVDNFSVKFNVFLKITSKITIDILIWSEKMISVFENQAVYIVS